MKKALQVSLLYEEKQATKWFLALFFGTFIIYEILYNYLSPVTPWGIEAEFSPTTGKYFLYAVMAVLIPISYYLMKTDKPYLIKYIIFVSYISINLIIEIWFYTANDLTYTSGNIVEVVVILFSPIFVNKRFFYLVSLGTMIKYLIVGMFLKYSVAMFPLILVFILSTVSFIILLRFLSYVDTVKESYDKQLEGIVKGVIETLELKDQYTRGHSERVAGYAMLLAEETGKFSKDELKYFYYACLLHDIGKIHIPDAILTKPGRLTDEEYDQVKLHTLVGAKALQDVEGISDIISVILHHHERWDGAGYPDGLKGEEISLLARITAIADAFDAMTSSRPYRPALPLEEAYNRVLEGQGSQFDPQLMDLFKRVYPDWKKFHENYYQSK